MIHYLSLVAWITLATLLMSVPESVPDQTPRQGSIGILALKHGSGERVPIYFHPGTGEDSFREWLAPGTAVHVIGRWSSKDEHWLLAAREDEEVPGVLPRHFWVLEETVRLPTDVLDALPFVLDRGLWLVDVSSTSEPEQLTMWARWNSWQWDPGGGGLWYAHSEASPDPRLFGPVSRLILRDNSVHREQLSVSGHLLAAPTGGAVLVRSRDRDTWPIGRVYIVESDGTTRQIGSQCWVVFSDAYHPFGTHAAWSPDGRHVVLRNSYEYEQDEGVRCLREGVTIYDRNGVVEPDLTDPDDPYRQVWYREPGFGDQVGTDEICEDRPPAVQKSNRRNRCQWSPDRQWFATMPGTSDDPHLGELLIYTADGAFARRFLVVGWPCNTFQWSPDSRWLAYGGPSSCA